MRLFALALLALCLLLLAASLAPAATCFADAEGVRHVNPGSWPSWTKRMEGHKGKRCWIPSERKSTNHKFPAGKDAGNDALATARVSEGSDKTVPKTVQAGASPATAPVPLSEIERLQKALVRAGQRYNFEERFSATGWK